MLSRSRCKADDATVASDTIHCGEAKFQVTEGQATMPGGGTSHRRKQTRRARRLAAAERAKGVATSQAVEPVAMGEGFSAAWMQRQMQDAEELIRSFACPEGVSAVTWHRLCGAVDALLLCQSRDAVMSYRDSLAAIDRELDGVLTA